MSARRTDANHAEIIRQARAFPGMAAWDTHELGDGSPDIVVWFRGAHLVEIKTDKGKLTPDEVTWHRRWPGPVHIVRSFEELLRAVGALEGERND